MRHHLISFVLLTSTLALGCNNEPGKGKERAAVAAPVAATAQTSPAKSAAADVKTVTYAFGPEGSTFGFVGAKVTGKHIGGFEDFEGTFSVPGGAVEKGQIKATVRVASLTSDAEKLTGHLKSADFLDVEKFPTATFTSTSIKAGGKGKATHTVTGNLELHGVTKSLTFPATVAVEGQTGKFESEFVINRKDFGIIYPGKPDDLIKDDVLLQLKLSGRVK